MKSLGGEKGGGADLGKLIASVNAVGQLVEGSMLLVICRDSSYVRTLGEKWPVQF